jgi:CheY-like chemotaxis protein
LLQLTPRSRNRGSDAVSGEEAVTLLEGHDRKYRALVTDINLKGKMDGWEVAQHAREIEPDFPSST